ncbi:MAG: hypothetical protein JWN46_3207 [Acidimicrobiales bacterium]|nr:hypothetical protein [Acidimicrobiales bacterium]
MTAVSFATVSDVRVLGVRHDGGLHAVRAFRDGEAIADHRRQLAGVVDVVERHGLTVARAADDIVRAHGDGRTTVLVTCEGADFVEGELERVAEAYDAGARSITLMHYRQNRFGDLQTEPPLHGGLTAAGRELVGAMNQLGMVIDLAHATHATTLGVLEASAHPVMISHSHLNGGRRDHARLISAEHARAVASAGGLVGAWPAGMSSESFDDFVDEIARLVDAVGVDHVAIGTDLDANYRPVMTSYDQFGAIADGLARRGFSPADADRVLGANALDLMRLVCG